MEVKKSTVKSVQSNGTWDGKFGTMYKYEIEMTNGDTGEYMSKSESQDKFKQGAVVDYQYYAGDYPKIKPHFEKNFNQSTGQAKQTSNNNDTQMQIIRQSSVRTAVEFCNKDCTIEELIRDAEIIAQYCYSGQHPTTKESNNDLPF